VAAQRARRELLQLGDRLHARVAGAGEHERQPPRRVLGRRVGELDLAHHAVAQPDRVGQVLEPGRVLAQPRHVRHPRDRAERDHQLLVLDLEVAGLRHHAHDAPVGIDRYRAAEQEIGVRRHRAQRHRDVAWLDAARGRLRQQRRVEHEVRRVDDRGAAAAEASRDVAAGKAAAQHEHATARRTRGGEGHRCRSGLGGRAGQAVPGGADTIAG
jgi:hypothetical protein